MVENNHHYIGIQVLSDIEDDCLATHALSKTPVLKLSS